MPSAVAVIGTAVEYIACALIATGTQLAAIVPSGSGQLSRRAPSCAGIAPSTYMQPSTAGVLGMQSGPGNVAEPITPEVPAMRSATRLSSRGCSPASSRPEPLRSAYGAAVASIVVAAVGGAPAKSITRSGPPLAPAVVPVSGSKLAGRPFAPHRSPGSHIALRPETSRRR